MKITVLGSAAAEAMPALWCECETCAIARERGGRDVRRRTSYCIDDDTLVDFGPDAFWQTTSFNIDLRKIDRIVFTHRHSDHLNPLDLAWRRDGFSVVTKPLKVFGSRPVFVRLMKEVAGEGAAFRLEELRIVPQLLQHGKRIEDGGLGILPLAANHDPGGSPFIFVLSRGGRKVLICNDTGDPPEATWQCLAGQGIDAAFIDSTMGLAHADCASGHMGVKAVVKARDRLLACGALKPDAQVFANHFSHNGHALHADLEAFFAPKGIGVGYDGLVVSC
ncbi:MAG: MBL fold metallo-hydrolase [Kiritimatiellae bacterium]|nr:MBL fold metallo-hydrolase [Kiritimatiellia bacterium]